MIYTGEAGWVDFTPLPVPTQDHCQVSVGDNVYVVGGLTAWSSPSTGYTGDTYKLSLSTKLWVKQSSLHTPRSLHGCTEWDDGVIVVGGVTSWWSSNGISSVEKYNPVSNKWSTFTPLPRKMFRMQVLVWDNDLYVLGGYGRAIWYSKKVFKLKHDEDTWEEIRVTPQRIYRRPVFPAVTLSTIHCT